MIRVLKNANFSGCGLGKVEIPIPATSEATAVVGKFPGISAGNEAKLRNFIDKLVYQGIFQKLTYLAIPYVAGSTSEAIQNVLLDEGSEQPTAVANMILGKDSGNKVIGLTFDAASPGVFQLQNYRKGSLEIGEFSMGTCIVYPNTNGSKRVLGRHPNVSSAPRFDYMNSGVNALVYSGVYVSNTQGSYNGEKNKNIQILSCSTNLGENGGLALNGYDNIVTLDATEVYSDGSGSNFLIIGGTSSVAFDGHYRLIFEGMPLTTDEIAYLRDEIATLCDY